MLNVKMGITIFKISFGEVYHRIYGQKSHFTAQIALHRKTKFWTVYRQYTSPIQLSPNLDAGLRSAGILFSSRCKL